MTFWRASHQGEVERTRSAGEVTYSMTNRELRRARDRDPRAFVTRPAVPVVSVQVRGLLRFTPTSADFHAFPSMMLGGLLGQTARAVRFLLPA